MAYYVRKIARAKWTLLDDSGSGDCIDDYRADAIANDMRTTNNTLSFWRAESLEPSDLNPVVVINSIMGDSIKKIDLLCVPEEMLSGYVVEQKDGVTSVLNGPSLHYDVTSLTVKRLLDFAQNIVLRIMLNSDLEPQYVITVPANQQYELICKWIDDGQLDYSCLKDHQKESVQKYKARIKSQSHR